MKPYLKVIWNTIKYNFLKRFKCPGIELQGLVLLNYNTKLSVCKSSHVTVGKNVVSDGRCVIIVDEAASVTIGDRCYFNEGIMISAKESVTIGSGCQFGPNVKIFDNNHCFDKAHGVLAKHSAKGILIGRNCWVAANAVILKGATIGDNCVIGAGCVVKGVIPPYSIVTQGDTLKIVPMEDR